MNIRLALNSEQEPILTIELLDDKEYSKFFSHLEEYSGRYWDPDFAGVTSLLQCRIVEYPHEGGKYFGVLSQQEAEPFLVGLFNAVIAFNIDHNYMIETVKEYKHYFSKLIRRDISSEQFVNDSCKTVKKERFPENCLIIILRREHGRQVFLTGNLPAAITTKMILAEGVYGVYILLFFFSSLIIFLPI